jgi:hypothetical protein
VPVSAIVTTPGSANANAYVDAAFVDQYHLDRPAPSIPWSTYSADQKAAAILWATVLLDSMWCWTGYPTDAVQALQWPRGGMLRPSGWDYVGTNEIPIQLKRACAEFARQLAAADRTADSDVETQGISSLRAGPVSLTFKDDVTAKVVPDAVVNLIPDDWGYPRGRENGYRGLVRS